MTTFHGTAGDDSFSGTEGDDLFLLGSGGDDTAIGNGGNDTFEMKHAYTDLDQISGGSGIDVLSLKGDYSHHSLSLANVSGIEIIDLAPRHHYNLRPEQEAIENGGNLTIDGATLLASDRLTFDGSLIVDSTVKLIGGRGDDFLAGGGEGDVIDGGRGQDQLFGDNRPASPTSADRFVFKALADSTVVAPDSVFWDPGTGDRIDLRHIDANVTLNGDQAFHFVGTAAFSDTPGELRYEGFTGGFAISGDVNGDGAADFLINVFPNNNSLPGSLIASDFLL